MLKIASPSPVLCSFVSADISIIKPQKLAIDSINNPNIGIIIVHNNIDDGNVPYTNAERVVANFFLYQ